MPIKSWKPPQEKSSNDVPLWTSCRVALAVISFIGFINVYAIRINISVAMVCLAEKPPIEVAFGSPNTTLGPINITYATSDDPQCQRTDQNGLTPIGGPKVGWNKIQQGQILSSFFYGYIVTQMFGGWIAGRFGGKYVFGVGMSIATLMTFLSPVAILNEGQSSIPIIAVRVIMGLGCGVVFPAMHSIWGKWAPPLERSKLMTVCYAGTTVGNIVALSLSGYLCQQEFLEGWPAIFYVFGALCVVWLCLWFYMVYDYPAQHPRITTVEKDYIETSIGAAAIQGASLSAKKGSKVPWAAFFMSGPLWAILIAHTCNNWGNYTLMTKLPTYMNDVLKFNIKENGLLSSLPYICMFVATISFGQIADCLREKKILSTTATRKLFQTVAFVGSAACMVATGFVTCDIRMLAVALLATATTFNAGVRSGFQINHVDISPKYAGELCGITNTVATIPGMVSPIIVSALTPNGTRDEWQVVFYVWAVIFGLGALAYLILASGEEQPWSKTGSNPNNNEDQTAAAI